MTYLEKFKMDHPRCCTFELMLTIKNNCPSDYGYMKTRIDCYAARMDCQDCWNQEIPEIASNLIGE